MNTNTSAVLVNLIASAHLKPVARATAVAQIARQGRYRTGGAYMPRTRDFVEQFAETSSNPSASKKPKPSHPASGPVTSRPEGPLTPAELAWLQRLPSDPSKVPFDDAVEVAGLVSKVTRMKDPAGARLLASVWQPIADFHDRRIAQDRLTRAQQPLPTVPHGALDALVEAVKLEDPELPDDVILSRANILLRDALDRRSDDHLNEQQDAQAAMQALDAAVAKRNEVAR